VGLNRNGFKSAIQKGSARYIVLCSHSHEDNNNVKPVLKEEGAVLERFVGTKQAEDIPVKGVELYMTLSAAAKGEEQHLYLASGRPQPAPPRDSDHNLTTEQAKEVGRVNVVFTPVAGRPP
jgi:hypothetical protein